MEFNHRYVGQSAVSHGAANSQVSFAPDTLREPSAVDLAREHMPLLAQPPAVGWDVHIALLEAARAHRLETPDLAHLSEGDDLGLQCALAAVLASAARH